ncbi:oxidoreductase [Neobacillus cucumis]|uniref:PDR/VanB family oxidoreductase n=1 Tax=Neobacillus cucumis TaxID=1740721 RepID=UPI0018E02C81|nr:PDR/VanB family oxidoreductase [Neobacillus cucumis]MBI0579279.1 oxidoreductase [Neobacillus cucumis]
MRAFGNIEVYVGNIVQETNFVKRFHLYPVDQESLPSFTGGSHIATYVKNGDELIERNYSLVSHPTDRTQYAIAIRKDDHSRGGSVYWHDQIKLGDRLEISWPKNHFPLAFQAAKHHVFYAAGIGITPFMTMMEDLTAEGKSFELHYAARTKEECVFYDDLNAKYPGKCHFYFSRTENPKKLTPVTMADHRIGSHVYFCGPVSMVKEFREAAEFFGYPYHSIHFELFAAADEGPKDPFVVKLANSGKEVLVSEEETLLDALLKAGVEAPYSCKVGGCGSCEVQVVEGEVDHRDHFYKDEERCTKKVILTCCSRAKVSDKELVLDL